jgi:hypothetical protein
MYMIYHHISYTYIITYLVGEGAAHKVLEAQRYHRAVRVHYHLMKRTGKHG